MQGETVFDPGKELEVISLLLFLQDSERFSSSIGIERVVDFGARQKQRFCAHISAEVMQNLGPYCSIDESDIP
jgi:hypothetical protein